MAVIAFSRSIGPVALDCIIRETPSSELDITEIPIESGAKVTDHAVVLPKRITLDVASGNAAATYSALVALQESRVPFTLVSGLTVLPNMLVKRIDAERDAEYSQILKATVDLQEAIIVSTAYAADPGGDSTGQRGKAGGQKSTRAAPTSSSRSTPGATADRAAGTTQRGDAGVRTVSPNRSMAASILGYGSAPTATPNGPQ